MKTASLTRLAKLGGLVGRVGASMAGQRVLDLGRSAPARDRQRTETLVANARRIVATLGELKGAAMKVGQMLSLHEALLPPEAAAVLRSLQQQAPEVPFEVMRYEVQGALPDFDELFWSLDPEPIAAASIGQVHRGLLRDGRRVAVKIQYPLIDEIVRADLDNLKLALRGLFSLVSKVDFEPVWAEVRDRLLEELDYEHEAANVERMAALWGNDPAIVIPAVVREATCRRVLTMEYVAGRSAEEVCSRRVPQAERDRWGAVLLRFVLCGLFEHRFLHADPNFANFAFLDDGRVIVYDCGCVKRIPQAIAGGYADLIRAVLEERPADIPAVLAAMGVHKEGGAPLPAELTTPYVELFADIFRADPPYTFGEDEALYQELFDLGLANWTEAADLAFPEDVIFIDRTLAGHFGNLSRLRATAPWRDTVLAYAQPT